MTQLLLVTLCWGWTVLGCTNEIDTREEPHLAENVAATNQTESDDRYRIRLSISGVQIEGAQQIAARLLGKTPQEQEAILDEPLPVLTSGQSFQLSVTVTDPGGSTTDYTQSARLQYDGFGCLTVTAAGFVTVTPSGVCAGPSFPSLWIIFKDGTGTAIAYNEYLFRLSE